MKKYLIINDNGTKKTVYARDLMQALKLGDAINIIPGMFITLKADPLHSVYRVKEINHGEYGVVLVRYSMWDGQLVERDAGGNYSFDSLKKNVTNIFSTYDEAKKYLLHHDAVRTAPLRKKNDSVDAAVIDKPIADETYNPEYSIQQFKSYVSNIIKDLYGNQYDRDKVRAISKLDTYVSQVIDDFKADIKNSNLDKRKTVQYYAQYVDALYEELTDVKNVQNIDGQSLKKIDDIHAKMDRSIHDSVKDSKVRDIDASSLMTLFTKYGKPYDYACKTRPKISSSGSKYLGQLVSYTLSPIGKYDIDKARNFVDFLNKKGYEATIFAPDIVVTLKQDRSSGLYHRGHERTNQYDSKVKVADDIDIDNYADSIKDSKIADIEPISHYIEAWRISNLAADLLYEAQKYGYSFDDVLKKYDAMTPKILALVKNKINEERNNMINWKQNHPDKLK